MKFDFEGKHYSLGFERRRNHIPILRNGKQVTILSTYPYTTATLYEISTGEQNGTVYNREVVLAYATVGCMPGDKFSNEQGRLQALKALNRFLVRKLNKSKEFRRAVWDAYRSRGRKQDPTVVEATAVTPVTQQLALPPAQDVVH